MPFAKSAKATPALLCALAATLGYSVVQLNFRSQGGSMKFSVQLLAISALSVLTACAAEDPFLFKATVHGVGVDVIPVEVSLSPNETRAVDLENGLVLEFTAPGSRAEGEQSMTRVLRKEGNELRQVHTTHEVLANGEPRENAYLVCGERVIFMSPPKDPLPECGV
jgi:hypothetical protein